MKIIGTIVAALIGLLVLSWALGWIGAAKQVVSVDNVRTQYAEAYKNYNSLKAIAANSCAADKALEAATDPSERIQRVTQATAQTQNYARVSALYDAAMQNAFVAKYVKPGDLPDQAPSLTEMKRSAC